MRTRATRSSTRWREQGFSAGRGMGSICSPLPTADDRGWHTRAISPLSARRREAARRYGTVKRRGQVHAAGRLRSGSRQRCSGRARKWRRIRAIRIRESCDSPTTSSNPATIALRRSAADGGILVTPMSTRRPNLGFALIRAASTETISISRNTMITTWCSVTTASDGHSAVSTTRKPRR